MTTLTLATWIGGNGEYGRHINVHTKEGAVANAQRALRTEQVTNLRLAHGELVVIDVPSPVTKAAMRE